MTATDLGTHDVREHYSTVELAGSPSPRDTPTALRSPALRRLTPTQEIGHANSSISDHWQLPRAQASNGWEPTDLGDPQYSVPPPPPDIWRRSDDVALLYGGKVNVFFGPSESLKSWAAQLACASTMDDGDPVVYVDFENDARSVRNRLVSLGCQETLDLCWYYEPSSAPTPSQWHRLLEQLRSEAQLVVLDGISNAMAAFGWSPLDHDDCVRFDLQVLRPLAETGAAVLGVDHTAKNAAGEPSPFGAQHKKAAVTGTLVRFEPVQAFGRGLKGSAALYLDKDKPGYLRQHEGTKGAIADLHLESLADGTIRSSLTPPERRRSRRTAR